MPVDRGLVPSAGRLMSSAWYERYFCADYWTYAAAEYTERRTAAEVGYLADVLAEHAPGRRVLDLGCGVGRHAVELARRGFEVVGLDVSAWALEQARAAARTAGVTIQLHRVDLLRGRDWPVGEVDAAICVQAFGWGSEHDQARMLRTIRSVLRPDGVLLLDHSNASAILRAYQPESLVEVAGSTFHFLRRYNALTGRSGGELRVRRSDGSHAVLPDDVRLYQPPEVAALLGRAGFTVARVDGDFVAGGPVEPDTRYVQFVSRVSAVAAPALVGHGQPVPADVVNLRWAPDEIEFVRDALDAAWARGTAPGHDTGAGHGTASGQDTGAGHGTAPGQLSEQARRYDLADPYAADRAAPVLSEHFGCRLAPERITAGTGATGLLRALAGLAVGGCVLAAPTGHPELPLAAGALGIPVRFEPLDGPAAVDRVGRIRPTLTVVDRPGVTGPARSLGAVRTLAEACADAGGALVVDETCASYLQPAASAVRLTGDVEGLVVVRSLSKGYCCGGLRIGFAVCSPGLAGAVRAVCPPLGVSALPVDVGLALLAVTPDVLVPLRARIARVKPGFAARLSQLGLALLPTDPRVPWVALPADHATRTELARRRLAGKNVVAAPGTGTAPGTAPGSGTAGLIRLAVPLSAERGRAVDAALGAGGSR